MNSILYKIYLNKQAGFAHYLTGLVLRFCKGRLAN